jgi:hypothetical protein
MTGTVRHLAFEGGAWGIEADGGEKLLPLNLDERWRVDGRRIRFRASPASVFGVIQWGRAVRLSDVRPAVDP